MSFLEYCHSCIEVAGTRHHPRPDESQVWEALLHTLKKSLYPYSGPCSQRQTLACWIVLQRGNVCVRGKSILRNSLKPGCHLCFDKALRTSLYGEIIAWWNKNSEESERNAKDDTYYDPSTAKFAICVCHNLNLHLRFNCSVKTFALEQIQKKRAWNMHLHMGTGLGWIPNLLQREEVAVGRVFEDETISFSTHLR